MLAVYGTTAFLCLGSLVVGDGVLRVCGYPARAQLAPAVGLSSLVVIASAVLWLPGHRTTAGVILALVTAAGAVAAIRARVRPTATALATAAVTLLAVSIPFAVNRHVGIFGVSIDDDFAAHFTWASSLYTSLPGADVFPDYPLGPHSLAASLAGLFGTTVEPPFTAILLSAPVLVALSAQAVLRDVPPLARVVGGVLVGLPYLVAGHLGEGSFKELTMGLIVIGIALTIRQLEHEGEWTGRRALAPGVMLGAALLIYGRAGLLWPAAGAVLWALATLARARLVPTVETLRRAAAVIGVALLCALLCSLSELTRLLSFSGGVPGGNVPTYPSPFEVLGVWFSGDFRATPADVFQTGLLVGLALALAVYALVWWLRRGDFAIPMAAVGSLLVYVVVRDRTGPYLTSKALVLAAPATMLALVVPLADACRADLKVSVGRIVAALAGVAFAAAALWSSGFALRYARVGSNEHEAELTAIRSIVRGKPTLDLVPDDFALWNLRGAKLSSPTPYSSVAAVPFTLRRPLAFNGDLDFDSVAPASLDSFDYIVTTTSKYASAVPSNWQLVASSRNFALWGRKGNTVPRSILGTDGEAPGAILDCSTAEGRALSRSVGKAAVWSTPPIGPSVGWQIGGAPLPSSPPGVVGAASGSTLTQTLALPPGRWEISLPYQSPADLYLIAGNLRVVLPSNLTNYGAYWRAGEVTSTGRPIAVSLRLQQMRFDAAQQFTAVGGLVAVRLPRQVTEIPLQRACGKYVDWYRQ
jgi:hypothetical protein